MKDFSVETLKFNRETIMIPNDA